MKRTNYTGVVFFAGFIVTIAYVSIQSAHILYSGAINSVRHYTGYSCALLVCIY